MFSKVDFISSFFAIRSENFDPRKHTMHFWGVFSPFFSLKKKAEREGMREFALLASILVGTHLKILIAHFYHYV